MGILLLSKTQSKILQNNIASRRLQYTNIDMKHQGWESGHLLRHWPVKVWKMMDVSSICRSFAEETIWLFFQIQ